VSCLVTGELGPSRKRSPVSGGDCGGKALTATRALNASGLEKNVAGCWEGRNAAVVVKRERGTEKEKVWTPGDKLQRAGCPKQWAEKECTWFVGREKTAPTTAANKKERKGGGTDLRKRLVDQRATETFFGRGHRGSVDQGTSSTNEALRY